MNPPLLDNILAQPESLREVAAYQLGEGRQSLEAAVEVLRSSRRIVFTGMGASLFACTPLAYALSARGVSVCAIESSELLYFLSPVLGRETAVVLVSRSGESVEVIRLVPLLEERGCRTIGVFNVRESTLAKRTEQPVFVGSPADELVAIQTYTGTLATLGLLGAAYENEWENATTALNETIAALQRLISECSSFCKSRNNFIEGTATLYLLARGAALASVEEGVLLMHEVAKAPAVGMSAAQFRHGPVEAIHKDFRAVIFGTQPVTMALDLSLAQDLSGMGAQVLWLGPEPNNTNLLTVSWPEKPAGRFAGILEAVPLQLLAYYMAIERGISPGKFRYTAAITSSETGFAHGKTI